MIFVFMVKAKGNLHSFILVWTWLRKMQNSNSSAMAHLTCKTSWPVVSIVPFDGQVYKCARSHWVESTAPCLSLCLFRAMQINHALPFRSCLYIYSTFLHMCSIYNDPCVDPAFIWQINCACLNGNIRNRAVSQTACILQGFWVLSIKCFVFEF